ncbi:16S rRNA (adenine(1518)-N(6)/adenine(1519)-N(6))-dimethyltransferase RsmA [bacterium]|nr:16S rRNA (adenine(1518)-N(6)/adenine(1519)-N(6))-dimethyltransferase RsmA [bacterium]
MNDPSLERAGASDAGALTSLSLLQRTRTLLESHQLRPVKSLGQNFLIDDNLARKIAAAALEFQPKRIVEVGPGLGALTTALADGGVEVVAFEKDRKLEAPLRELLVSYAGVELRMGDFLEAEGLDELSPGSVAVGNLPYYVTTPILEKLFLTSPPFLGVIVTVQREVAQRLTARPGTAEYGSLTVFCTYYMERVEELCRLGPSVFLPQPGVASSALRMIPRREQPREVRDPVSFFLGLRASFGYRRKTLAKALASSPDLSLTREQAQEVLVSAGIDGQRRGETLSFTEFVALGNSIAGHKETP